MNRRQKLKSKPDGFSIIEVVVAMFILVVMLLLYGAASNSMVLNRDARQKELALRILVSEIEELRAMNFGDLPVSGALSNSLLSLLPAPTLTLTMSDINPSFKKAVVNITWQDPANNNPRVMELSTYISSQGL